VIRIYVRTVLKTECRFRFSFNFSFCEFVWDWHFVFLWSPYVIGQTIYIFILWFLHSSSFFLSSPNLSRRRVDVCHTCIHGVALVRCRSETCCTRLAEIQDAKKSPKSPSGHHRTTLSGYIFATKAYIDNRKNLLSSNMSSTCPHNMANFGPLAAEIDPVVWSTPTNFNVLAAILHGI